MEGEGIPGSRCRARQGTKTGTHVAFSRQKIRKFSVRVGFLEQQADQQFMKSDYPLEDLPSLPPAYVTFRQFLLFLCFRQ